MDRIHAFGPQAEGGQLGPDPMVHLADFSRTTWPSRGPPWTRSTRNPGTGESKDGLEIVSGMALHCWTMDRSTLACQHGGVKKRPYAIPAGTGLGENCAEDLCRFCRLSDSNFQGDPRESNTSEVLHAEPRGRIKRYFYVEASRTLHCQSASMGIAELTLPRDTRPLL